MTGRAARIVLGVAVAVELACALALALGAVDAHRWLVPAARHAFPGWLHGPLPAVDAHLTSARIAALLVAMVLAYGVVLALAGRVPGRWPLAVCAAAIAICALAPPMLSADVFGYVAWGELGAHGVNPYSHASIAVGHEAVRPFLLWHHGITPYGPLFTASTYALAPLGVAAALWTLKAVAAICAVACVGLLWRTAQRLGRPPAQAAVALGLNPLVLVYGVGGAHNDLLLEALVLAGVLAVVAGRARTGASAIVAAAAVKASAIVALPFLVAGSPRLRGPVVAALATGAALLACSFAIFGTPLLNIIGELGSQQHDVAIHSIPAELARLAGSASLPGWAHLVADALLLAAVCALLVRTRRGADWLEGAGWAFVALLVTTAWLLPWYVAWAVPFAALAADRRLLGAVWGLTLLIVVLRLPLLT
ncbi:MAG: alpha,6-mannosyltransferase [Solirubrobacteraceae bacterium]|nr:alpha,6-mannosyltransferase [Solirubrobacteraceae bacterium]